MSGGLAANRAVFLDRDGTLNADKGYLHRAEDFEWLPGALQALRRLEEMGFLLVVLTNQSGIARGYYEERDFLALNRWMLDDLQRRGIHIARVYYCPHHPRAAVARYRAECDCRKPKLGMFERAIRELRIDAGRSYAIGDKLRDCALCLQTECRGFLIGQKEPPDVIERVKAGAYARIGYCAGLPECAEKIARREERLASKERGERR